MLNQFARATRLKEHAMDEDRFDTIIRLLTATGSRRSRRRPQ